MVYDYQHRLSVEDQFKMEAEIVWLTAENERLQRQLAQARAETWEKAAKICAELGGRRHLGTCCLLTDLEQAERRESWRTQDACAAAIRAAAEKEKG